MSIYYSPETVKRCRNRYIEIAMKTATPRRYAGMLYEAAEIITQLQNEIKTLKDAAEVTGHES